jgi:hypothetical protein
MLVLWVVQNTQDGGRMFLRDAGIYGVPKVKLSNKSVTRKTT